LVVEDPDIVSKINQHLPDQIKVWGYTPVTGGFHAKKACNGREYEYWLPTYTLEIAPCRSLQLRSSREHPSDLYIAEENAYIPVSTRENIAQKHQCRISTTKLEQFRDAMAVFQGTHNFHNYTIQRNASDPSANRYIMQVGQPKQFDGMEWVNVKLRGQAFMLHQIRKMIAMAMLVTRTDTPTSVISQSFEPHKINIPKAPALGLLLEKPLFDGYNQRIADRPDRSPISFDLYKSTNRKCSVRGNSSLLSFFTPSHTSSSFLVYTHSLSFFLSFFLSLTTMSFTLMDDLTHAVAGVAHVEKPYQEGQLHIRKLEIFRQPTEQTCTEAKAKLFNCEIESEKKRCDEGIKKAQALVDEAQIKLDQENEKIHQAESQNEKYAVDHRSLVKYREELTELLDGLLKDKEEEDTVKEAKEQMEAAKARLDQSKEDAEKLDKVRELLDTADKSMIEAIVELRESNDKKTVPEGQVYFPEEAFKAIKEARELYPALPGIPPPVIYDKKPDETGAFYSPMQKYLWDIRHGLSDIRKWCDVETLALMDKEHEAMIELGAKTDAWNMARRN
ncbi:pseudouridine synthase, partial [Lichtheimia hyalospora FSU 10163]